jgi:DNA-binding CsgD family transcriptional regulator
VIVDPMGTHLEASPDVPPGAAMALEISDLVAAHTDHYDGLLDAAAQIICRAMGDICVIGLLSDDRRVVHPLGLHPVTPASDSEQGTRERELAIGEPSIFMSGDLGGKARNRWVRAFVDGGHMRSAVAVAMRVSGTRKAVLAVARLERSPVMSREDLPLVQGVADRLALVVENMWLKEDLERLRDRGRGHLRDPRLQELTARELEVLALLGQGLTNRDVAQRLYLSVRTVEWHRGRLTAKLGEHERSALIALGRTLLG